MNPFFRQSTKLSVIIAGFAILPLVVIAINTVATGYRINNATNDLEIDAHTTCKKVSNASGRDHFIPTKTSLGWQRFRDNLPASLTLCECAKGNSCGGSVCVNAGSLQCDGSTCSGTSNKAAGTDTGLCRECDGSGNEQADSDDTGCGTIDCDGLNYYYASGGASATGTNYIYLRDYNDITSNRCEGLSDCKDANTADCTSFGDQLHASCGTCRYASGSSSSCFNYSNGTNCGSTGCPSDYYNITGSQSATSTSYCTFYDYPSSVNNTCNGSGTCNSGSCSASSSTQATAGTCRYISGCSGGTSGTVSYYSNGTYCGSSGCPSDYYAITGTQSATSTSYCTFYDYPSTVNSTCNGSGSCNSGSCSASSSTQATAGTCKYISNCSGGTSGTVTNYASGTSCGTNLECDGSGNCVQAGINCYADNDGDGYGAGSPTVRESCLAGEVTDNTDCYDSNANAKPSQTSYFSSHRGDGSYDYNCNSTEDKRGNLSPYTNCDYTGWFNRDAVVPGIVAWKIVTTCSPIGGTLYSFTGNAGVMACGESRAIRSNRWPLYDTSDCSGSIIDYGASSWNAAVCSCR